MRSSSLPTKIPSFSGLLQLDSIKRQLDFFHGFGNRTWSNRNSGVRFVNLIDASSSISFGSSTKRQTVHIINAGVFIESKYITMYFSPTLTTTFKIATSFPCTPSVRGWKLGWNSHTVFDRNALFETQWNRFWMTKRRPSAKVYWHCRSHGFQSHSSLNFFSGFLFTTA